MKGFIEIHTIDVKTHLVNIRHIVEVDGSIIYTDDLMSGCEYPHFECEESYEEIKDKIAEAAS